MSEQLVRRIKGLKVQMARALAEGKIGEYLDMQVSLGIMLRNEK
jgi:hypothetical protein